MTQKENNKMFSTKQAEQFSIWYYEENVGKNSFAARQAIKELDYKNNHCFLRMIAQTYLDEAIFERGDKMRKKINLMKLRHAQSYINRSYAICKDCIKTLWVMAKVFEKYDKISESIQFYRLISKTDINKSIHYYCVQDKLEAAMIVNDSLFELYRSYYEANKSLSNKYLQKYLTGLSEGISTIYYPIEKYKPID